MRKPAAKKSVQSKSKPPANKTKTWDPKEIIEDSKRKLAKKAAGDLSEAAVDPKLLAAIKGDKVAVSEDKLDQIRAQCKIMRNLTLEIKTAQEAIAVKQKELTALSTKTLPELFAENNIPSITLGKEGNYPEIVLESKPFYKAVLPAEKDPGLRWLENKGHGDLIKRVFVVKLPMKSAKAADQLRKLVQKLDLAYEEEETVPWATLTAFVKEMIEKRKKAVPLEILGAIIGRVVKMKPKRDEG